MKIATISREGLVLMALLVALLWGCGGLERWRVSRANRELRSTLHEMRLLRAKAGATRTRPASARRGRIRAVVPG
jgi:hypothetical protein